ncbi:Membrane bound hydrogenase subunit mbhF [Thermovirga lienii DSM 17291]|jgi:multicomponent Na+:H+ antiporter subunit B|uniref:Membrane bound hydrogenase subunit mbhF n=1 Tax=Thermovirga lienii (strain ATCC BAA-1197 / DSM 17291 / Cas60314) TaxID=580340 RepID=G7V5M8_THELD|nr:MnhB domain-containing protein [Thermovirga lienii]AER66938.1 Membrane bound hydrogenase subunit mbhF [Thermovirga lienii DSM 17291]MDN5318044.1 energy-converting hydrogenase subunit [Thermovirga sp.]MDN5367615.1 energy-converting hydrogenase subunit [Thermovirga sp.]HCD72009.1 sodium:proton antiporter [Thermovirga lienii]
MYSLSVIVRTICDVFAWFLAVFGVYVIVHGHLTPGGGFQGGAVVATLFAFLLVAYGGKKFVSFYKSNLFSWFETIGLLVFIGTGLLGLGTTFFYNFLAGQGGLFGSPVPIGPNSGVLNSSGTIALMNMAVGLEVIGGLSLILYYMFKGIRLYEESGSEETGHDG